MVIDEGSAAVPWTVSQRVPKLLSMASDAGVMSVEGLDDVAVTPELSDRFVSVVAATVRVRFVTGPVPLVLVAERPMVNGPDPVGVPDMNPVDVLNVRPVGKLVAV